MYTSLHLAVQLIGVEVSHELLHPGLHERLAQDLLDVRPLLRVGGEHVVHEGAEVLGVLGGHAGELALDDLAGKAVQAGSYGRSVWCFASER